jgi:uncharacterized membrane protein YfcA
MIDAETALLLGVLFFGAAILYSSVGHGGASGYLAAMGLVGVAPAIMRPTALVMNIAVSSISLYKFARANGFNWRLFLPFAITSVPMAFVGGRIQLPIVWFGVLVGAVLLFSSVRLFLDTLDRGISARAVTGPPPLAMALLLGAAIGLLSGLTGWWRIFSAAAGTMGWATVRDSAALQQHSSDQLGFRPARSSEPATDAAGRVALLVAVVIAGGLIGATLRCVDSETVAMRRALAAVWSLPARRWC